MGYYDDLLHRAKWETISQAEIDHVIEQLRSPSPATDRYTLLHILGKGGSGAPNEVAVVESFLSCEEEPMLSRLALQILCHYWGMADRYLETVLAFIEGTWWDTWGDCRLVALSIAGEYLRRQERSSLLKALLKVFEEDDDDLMRQVAYSAIARAMGAEFSDLPPASRMWDLDVVVDPDIMRRASVRLVQGQR